MSYTVIFLVRSNMQNDLRRIQIENQGYPFQPQIGGHICFQSVTAGVCLQAKIVDVEFPASNYFKGPLELTCYAELHHADFDTYYKWLECRKAEQGLTAQWESWSLFKI